MSIDIADFIDYAATTYVYIRVWQVAKSWISKVTTGELFYNLDLEQNL